MSQFTGATSCAYVLSRTLSPCATSLPPFGEQWLHEIKFDGWRISTSMAARPRPSPRTATTIQAASVGWSMP
jgi:hypothetical protein